MNNLCATRTTKRCWACGVEKPLGQFYRYFCTKRGKERVERKCKDCSKSAGLREHRLEKYSKKYPEKILARRLVREAIKRGDIVRKPCVKCGEKKAQAHHDDYSKPLEVRWLCSLCHTKHHRSLAKK